MPLNGEVSLDSSAVLTAMRARAGQTYMELLDEISKLSAYAQTLETRLAAMTATPGDAWGDTDSDAPDERT